MEEVVIVSGVRTAIGGFGGSFRDYPAYKLGAAAIKAALEKAGIDGKEVDDVIFGCHYQVGEDGYMARHCAVEAGLPVEVPAYTVNRICGSGLEAINTATRAIMAGDASIVVAGGVENMSQLPYILRKARWGYRLGDSILEDVVIQGLNCPFNHYHMGVTAENVAERFEVSRQAQDEMALMSHQRAVAAIQEGRFKEQILPITVPQPRGEPKVVDTDEHPRPDTSLEKLAKLPTAFKKDGTVTAGNSSGLNDAAAAVVLMSRRRAQELGLKPRLFVRDRAASGVDPAIMGMGPLHAVRKVLKNSSLKLEDIDLVELNEAFAAQAVAVVRGLGLDWSRVNVNGGAVALGHPIGASGCILTVKLMHEMERRGSRYGLVTLCIGGGQGIATIFERAA
ncbi:MAG: acetyl-CoA C-acetyltransferase [Chloroflexi bacterium]|nr:acetyl-CoA C-acetyltransferase [Chloroflexota bacterium]